MEPIKPQQAVKLMKPVKCIHTTNTALKRQWTEDEVQHGRKLSVDDTVSTTQSKSISAIFSAAGWIVKQTLGYLRFCIPLLRPEQTSTGKRK